MVDSRLLWAAAQGDRAGLLQLGRCYRWGWGCAADKGKLFKRAAELECAGAQWECGEVAFAPLDWQRFLWWGRAAVRGHNASGFCLAVLDVLPSFQMSGLGRILHSVAPLIRGNPYVAWRPFFGRSAPNDQFWKLQKIVELHDAMLDRARDAVECWSMAGRRCGVVKDIRVMIAKMAWQDAWRWHERSFWGRPQAPKKA